MSARSLERIVAVCDEMVVRAEKRLARASTDFTDAMLSLAAARRELDDERGREPGR